MKVAARDAEKFTIRSEDLSCLFDILTAEGYTIIGPFLRQGAIVYEELTSADDLPAGWTDIQEGGSYRLAKRNDTAYFGYNVGPHSWKKFLFPPNHLLWKAKRKTYGFEINSEPENDEVKYAFLGVRSCELHAIEIQDKVFIQGEHTDPTYKNAREKALIIAVNCTQAGGTCFCTSMQTGPQVTSGFDISLTEIISEGTHYFLAETGSETGQEIMNHIPHNNAAATEVATAENLIEQTANSMGRKLNTNGIKEIFYGSYENDAVWNDVANRCLSCGNCTLVCPTCFCSTVEDVTDLSGENAERWRKWDSCFNLEFSYIHGGNVRSSVQSRYRQWISHKLASWIDQFGSSGCVGCGRCITWCPVAIDITAEAAKLRQSYDKETNVSIENTGESS